MVWRLMTWCSLEPGVFPHHPPLKKTPCGFQHNFDTFQPFLGGAKESGVWDQKSTLPGRHCNERPPRARFQTCETLWHIKSQDRHVDLYVPRIQWLGSTVMITLIDPHFVCVGKIWLTGYYLLTTSRWFSCKHFLFTAIDPQHEKKNIRMETRLIQSSSLLS